MFRTSKVWFATAKNSQKKNKEQVCVSQVNFKFKFSA